MREGLKWTKIIWLVAGMIYASAGLTQMTAEQFGDFSRTQDSLINIAYENRNFIRFYEQTDKLLRQYDLLPISDQRDFSGHIVNAYYNLACVYSLEGNKPRALESLKKSIDLGFIDYDHIQVDSDLNNIREEPEFIKINHQLRLISDYPFILKRGGNYDNNDHRDIPGFTYQSAEDSHLSTLKEAFNLDSIAGQGTDIFQMINLMNWIHYLVPHDGNNDNPVVRNALSMIAECKRDNRGLNCRGLATVLNECYLSLGMKSRIVTCLPKDSLQRDNDCHVINAVYSESLKKWIWMDPTMNAYVMNERGELLSIQEVREKLILGEPLILNPDANWNRQSTDIDYYLHYYMSKNLYILECPLHSEYNMETREAGRAYAYVQLIPTDYFIQKPDKSIETDTATMTTWTTYRLNNPETFWESDE